jgi:parvulin-like peptidyl-prolyl isomerase
MNAPIQKPAVTVADYKAAEERLRQTQAEASVAFNKAQEAGDLAQGSKLIAQQREALDAFKAFRAGIPADVLLSINADRILESFSVDTENFANLVIPSYISDEDAMHALNKRFRELFPEKNRGAIYERDLEDILNAGDSSGRRAREPRVIKLIAVVPSTTNMTLDQQAKVLQQKGLKFPHPIEQALAAAAFACKNNGGDLFNDLAVRGSVPGFALFTFRSDGVRVRGCGVDCDINFVAASGSPSPELKRL